MIMFKRLFLILFLLLGTSCTRPLSIFTSEVPRERLDLSAPAPITERETEFKIVTQQNAQSIFNELKKNGQDPILIALPLDSYNSHTLQLNDLDNYIKLLQQTLASYRTYYKPVKTEKPKGFWDKIWGK